MKKEKGDSLIAILVVIAALLGAINAYTAMRQVSDLARITGFQTFGSNASGNITLTLPSNVQIDFLVAVINWSSGSVDSSTPRALLKTSSNLADQVQNGSWANGTGNGRDTGLILANIGNTNVSINLTSGKYSGNFFLPLNISGTEYQWNLTNNETGSCGTGAQLVTFGSFRNTSINGEIVCSNMSYLSSSNQLRIDILLAIPVGVQKSSSGYSDTITAIATESSS